MIEPRDIRTRADLHAALAELHQKDSRQRSFHEFAAEAGIDGVATVHGMVNGTSFPRRQTLTRALIAWGVPKTQHAEWFMAYERASKDNSARFGRPLAEIINPFELEVHRSISIANASGLPALPPYVPRAHDRQLAEIVQRAIDGESAMAVLVAGSSAGKTRTLWEALTPLRDVGGWRLWHPLAPTRSQALDELAQVRARTVVWLNESQEYLGGDDDTANERIAVALERLLADHRRAPVLVLGTLWPVHHARLRRDPASQVRKLLEAKAIAVPEAFTGEDLEALNGLKGTDPRLARAIEKAEDGQVTQYLAGGPELVNWYLYSSSAAAKAVVDVAIDARRMGHRNALPYALLREAARSYMTGVDRDQVGENWLEQALADTSTPCKGARGPVTRIDTTGIFTGRRIRSTSRLEESRQDTEPLFQLADYLDQYGRIHRAGQIPPLGFWQAIAGCAHPEDLTALGNSASQLFLYRDAAQLWKNAVHRGVPHASYNLLMYLYAIQPTDHRPAVWIVERVNLSNLLEVNSLLAGLRDLEANDQISLLLVRDPATHVQLNDPDETAELLTALHELGAVGQVAALADRVVSGVSTGYRLSVRGLLETLRRIGANPQMTALADRVVADMDFEYLEDVGSLQKTLHGLGIDSQLEALIHRVVGYFEGNDPDFNLRMGFHDWGDLAKLFRAMHSIGRDAPAIEAANYLVDQTDLDDLWNLAGFGDLLNALDSVGAHAHADMLASLVTGVEIDDWEDQDFYLERAEGMAGLLEALHRAGDDKRAISLAQQFVTERNLGDLYGCDDLQAALEKLGDVRSALELMKQIVEYVARIDLRDIGEVAHCVEVLHGMGADTAMAALLTRDPVAYVELGKLWQTVALAKALHEAGEETQLAALLGRIAEHGLLRDLEWVTHMLSTEEADTEDLDLAVASVVQGQEIGISEGGNGPDSESWLALGREPDGSVAEPWTWDDLD